MRALPDPTHRRRLSPVERLWLTARRIAPPFANQVVCEAPGGDLDAADWGAALAEVARTTPGSSVVARGALGWTKWVDAVPPRLRRVDGSAWSGLDGGGAPFLAAPLDPVGGPACEVLLVDGPVPRIVIRSLHAACDGRGTLFLAERMFAAARGETLEPLPNHDVNDEELATELGGAAEPAVPVDCPSPLGEVRPAPLATRWVRRDVPSASGRGLLPRVAVALARRVPEELRGAVRIDVPVDLRRHRPELHTPANLTGLVRVPVGALLDESDPADAVARAVRAALDAKGELAFCASMGGVRWLPLGLMEWGGRRAAHQALAAQRFSDDGHHLEPRSPGPRLPLRARLRDPRGVLHPARQPVPAAVRDARWGRGGGDGRRRRSPGPRGQRAPRSADRRAVPGARGVGPF